jgi:hypothetical protein
MPDGQTTSEFYVTHCAACGRPFGPEDRSPLTRLRANAGLIASIAVLLLALILGVVIGTNFGNDDTVTVVGPAPVVRVTTSNPATAPTLEGVTAETTPSIPSVPTIPSLPTSTPTTSP